MAKEDKYVKRLLKDYAKSEKSSFIKGFILSLIRTGLELLTPIILGYVINNLIKKDMKSDDLRMILVYLILYVSVSTLAGVIANRTTVSFEKASSNIAYKMQNDVYEKVNSFPIAYFDSLPAGKISSRITNDTNKMKVMFRLLFTDIATASILVLGLIITLFITNPIAGMMLLPLAPVVYIIYKSFTNYTRTYTGEIRKNTSEINAQINEYIQNMEVIQVYNK